MDDYKEWLSYAKADLEAAKMLRNKLELCHIAIFHCHECMEKALKALWIKNGFPVKRTHDIRELLTHVWHIETWLTEFKDGVADVQEYFGMTRYPASENLGILDSQQCFVIAEIFYETLLKKIVIS